MHTHYLLRSSTLRMALLFSIFISIYILLFSSGGLYFLRKRQLEIVKCHYKLQELCTLNTELDKEVCRFTVQDPELYESLARQSGLSRKGETIYTFYNDNSDDGNADN